MIKTQKPFAKGTTTDLTWYNLCHHNIHNSILIGGWTTHLKHITKSNWIHLPQIFRVKIQKIMETTHLVGNFEHPNCVPFQWLKAHLSASFIICHSILPSSRPNSHPTHEECTNCPTTCHCRFSARSFFYVAHLWHNSENCRFFCWSKCWFSKQTPCKNIINYGSPQNFPDTNAAFIYSLHKWVQQNKVRYSPVKSLINPLPTKSLER